MSQIELIKIKKSYDGHNMVINDISVSVKKGEFFVLVGPSGCGKSTLLRMIAGLENVTDGELRIGDVLANNMHPKDRNLSMVFQNYALYPHMNVRENMLFGLDIKGVSKEEQNERMYKTAELLGLSELLNRRPGNLSGGQRQRVALARSICSNAPVCLMDEPLSNLDAKLRAQMRIEIKKIQRKTGLTMIYVTHDQVEAMTMGDRIMVLDNGKIQQIGSPIELYNKPANVFVATFIGSPKMNVASAAIAGENLILNSSIRIKINDIERKNLPKIDDFIIAIRPEDILPKEKSDENYLEVEIVSLEMLGNESQIGFAVGEDVFLIRWQGQWNYEVGSKIQIKLLVDNMLIFDKDTKRLIRSAMHVLEDKKETEKGDIQ